jgi:hypothetical protein
VKPSDMPQQRRMRPVQGRFSYLTLKWQNLSNTQSWEEASGNGIAAERSESFSQHGRVRILEVPAVRS